MSKLAGTAAVLLFASAMAAAQDVPGIEDCTKTSGLDKRTGCFQSNINYLQSIIAKGEGATTKKLNAAETEIIALKASLAALQKKVEDLQAAAVKKPEDSKPKP